MMVTNGYVFQILKVIFESCTRVVENGFELSKIVIGQLKMIFDSLKKTKEKLSHFLKPYKDYRKWFLSCRKLFSTVSEKH